MLNILGKTVYIVPVANFAIEKAFKLGDTIFSPAYEFLQNDKDSYTNTLSEGEFLDTYSYISKLHLQFPQIESNSSFLIIEDELTKNYTIQDSFLLVNQISEKADRALDYFRLKYCRIGKYDTLPGIAGFTIDGYKTLFQYDPETCQLTLLPGEVTFMIRAGIGLMPSNEPTKDTYDKPLYISCFSDRDDIVFNTCRNALRRVVEAMYMNNLSTAFIYLMSTLEMLASPEWAQFKKVKPKILPFISKSKMDYHDMSTYLKDLSKNKRTEIVHNGKNIYEIYDSLGKIESELFKITGMIINYVEEVIKSDIKTLEELEEKRLELSKGLKI